MTFEVLRTPQVRRTVEQEMDRAARASYEAARDELRGRGCQAGGYRLAAADDGDYPLCARHLAYDWRLFSAYPGDQRIILVFCDRHTRIRNPAAELAETLPGLGAIGRRRNYKPPCCADPAEPPPMTDELRQLLAAIL